MSYTVPIIFGVCALAAAAVVVWALAHGAENQNWIIGPFIMCLFFLVLGGLMGHYDRTWNAERKSGNKIHELEMKLATTEGKYRWAQETIERQTEIAERNRYDKDVAEHGEQIARLKRIERRLDGEKK